MATQVPQRKYAPHNSRLPSYTPILGLGCSSFSSFFSSQDEQPLTVDNISRDHVKVQGWIETIRHAVLDRGINFLDTAPWYGHGTSEITVGYALDAILTDYDDHCNSGEKNSKLPEHHTRKRTGSLPRSSLIINTKVGRYESNPLYQFDFSYDTTIRSVHRSLKRMNCGYIDVIQLHDPEFAPSLTVLKEETIPALLECRRKGWTKAIGMTGYPLEVQHRLLVECQGLFGEAVFDQSLVYCHNNLHDMSLFRDSCFPPLDTALQGNGNEWWVKTSTITYAQFCQQSNIHLMAAAPLSMGLLTVAGPQPWHPATASLKEACATAANMCESKGVNISSLALLYSLSQSEVGCTLLGMNDLQQVDVAADLAMRFRHVSFDVHGSNKETTILHHHDILKILGQVLTPRESEALAQLMDETHGPFAAVLSNGEYRWDGQEEAKQFWLQVGELIKGNAEIEKKK